MNLASTIWDAMGWCPMHAAPQLPAQDPERGNRVSLAEDRGPVARRSALFMRLAWGTLVLSWAIAFLALPYLPEIIPIHWGLHGNADGFAGRFIGILGLPAFATLFMVILILLPRYDAARYSLEAFRDAYAIVIFATMALFFCIEAMTIAIGLGAGIPVVTVIPILIGILFIVMGGLMPHIGRNRTMGIRLPWTLASDRIWKETHQYGSKVFMAAGVLVVLGSLASGIWALTVMLVIILGSTAYICAWSYRLSKRSPGGDG